MAESKGPDRSIVIPIDQADVAPPPYSAQPPRQQQRASAAPRTVQRQVQRQARTSEDICLLKVKLFFMFVALLILLASLGLTFYLLVLLLKGGPGGAPHWTFGGPVGLFFSAILRVCVRCMREPSSAIERQGLLVNNR
jgi:hypothetical protein